MPNAIAQLLDKARSPNGQKAIKYTLVSVISVAVSLVVQVIVFGFLRWTARTSSITATSVGAIPSYYLNRAWAWGKRGRSHFWKEIVPFWVIALVGLAFSVLCTGLAGDYVNRHHMSHLYKTIIVTGAYLGSFGVLWIAKFIIFNKLIFVQDEDLQAALADEVVG